MAYTTPTQEPTTVRAGDTWTWARDLPDFPASTWTLTYTLYNASAKATLTASAEGARHLVSQAPAATALIVAGRYDWISHVSDGTARHQVGAGRMEILPNLSAVGVTAHDGRSHARRMLEAIEAILEGRATAGDLDTVKAQWGERAWDRDPATLAKLHAQYAARVAQEDAALAAIRGEPTGRMIQMVFR